MMQPLIKHRDLRMSGAEIKASSARTGRSEHPHTGCTNTRSRLDALATEALWLPSERVARKPDWDGLAVWVVSGSGLGGVRVVAGRGVKGRGEEAAAAGAHLGRRIVGANTMLRLEAVICVVSFFETRFRWWKKRPQLCMFTGGICCTSEASAIVARDASPLCAYSCAIVAHRCGLFHYSKSSFTVMVYLTECSVLKGQS